jgi:hypothetical protein
MAKNDELAARYPDLLGDDKAVDRALVETVRALDALYTVDAPAQLDAHGTELREIAQRAAGHIGMGRRPVPREADNMRVLRTEQNRRWSGIAAAAAACVVVGLLAALLIGGRGGPRGRLGSGGPNSTGHGGLQLTAEADCPQGASSGTSSTCTQTLPEDGSVLRNRLSDALRTTNVTVRIPNDHGLDIELPGVMNVKEVTPLLAQGSFTVVDTGGISLPVGSRLDSASTRYPVVFTGTQLDPASVGVQSDRQTGQAVVTFAFAGSARQAFVQYTAHHIGGYLTLALDGVVIESATIQSQIDGVGQITGLSHLQAPQIAAMLKYGPLAVPLKVVYVTSLGSSGAVPCVSPTAAPGSTPTAPPAGPAAMPTATPTPAGTPGAGAGPSTPWVIICAIPPTPGPAGTAMPTATPGPVGTVTPMPMPTPTATPAAGGIATPTPLPLP